ncbi:hypothetical protein [Comamonas piscis]
MQTTKPTLVVWPQSAGKTGWQAPRQAALQAAGMEPMARDAVAQHGRKSLIFRHFLRMTAAAPQNNK